MKLVAVLISDKVDRKAKKITRVGEGLRIVMKESIHQENIAMLNVYMPNKTAETYEKQNLIEQKGKINS